MYLNSESNPLLSENPPMGNLVPLPSWQRGLITTVIRTLGHTIEEIACIISMNLIMNINFMICMIRLVLVLFELFDLI